MQSPNRWTRLLAVLALFLCAGPGLALHTTLAVRTALTIHTSQGDAGAAAYRRGDYTTAVSTWKEALRTGPSDPEKARLAYDIGNAVFRDGEPLRAVAWYTAALRHAPRDGDTWDNLEFARSAAELEPADRGDLADTSRRVLRSVTLAESEYLVLFGLLLLALVLRGEALWGGQAWRRAAIVAAGVMLLLLIPWIAAWVRSGERVLMCVQDGGVAARSEPRLGAQRITDIAAGEIVAWTDSLPGWTEVRVDSGRTVWVRERALFDLTLDSSKSD